MACLKVIRQGILMVLAEQPDGNVRTQAGDHILGVEMKCGPMMAGDDLESLLTPEGLMLGNLVKKLTTSIGIKQCFACKQRQRRLNELGLRAQQKVKDAILRS